MLDVWHNPMDYDLHITRRKSWVDSGDDITLEEFIAYVQKDPEFRYPSEMGDDYAEWKSPRSSYETWLCWQNGNLQTKNPEPEFIDKMVTVAKALAAQVQGDDGEVYLSATQVIKEPEAQSGPEIRKQSPRPGIWELWMRQPLWKRLLMAFLLGCALLTLKLLIFGS